MRLFLATVALVLLVVASPVARADTMITMNSTTAGLPGTPDAAGDVRSTIWFSTDQMRVDRTDVSIIVDVEANKVYIVQHEPMTYSALDLPVDLKKLLPAEMQPMADQLAEQMKMEIEVTPTDQTRQIAGYQARLYQVKASNTMGITRTIDMWMAEEIDLDVAAFKRLNAALFSLEAMGGDWYEKILEIEGFPVLQESQMTMMGQETSTREELISIEQKDSPQGHYAPPADYKEEPFDLLGMAAQDGQ
jgi:hypothetical protein